MEKEKKPEEANRVSSSLKIGAVALAFIIIGYQAALFVHSAAVARIESHHDKPDTVFVVDEGLARKVLGSDDVETRPVGSSASGQYRSSEHKSNGKGQIMVRKDAEHSPAVDNIAMKAEKKMVESFDFDPNTATLRELVRLGFSEKQAQSIINYREKGGRYRRAEDFAKSFVVSDSVYARLKEHIKIPKIDINAADSAAFDALPGIGPYFAAKMVSYREELRGYSFPEQLMDIYNFDKAKFDGLKDLIIVGASDPYPVWSLPEEELEKHPYIGKYGAHGIVIYRENNPREKLTAEGIVSAGILKSDLAAKFLRCRLASPEE